MVLVCHVISQDHLTKSWSNIMDYTNDKFATFGGHRHSGSGDDF